MAKLIDSILDKVKPVQSLPQNPGIRSPLDTSPAGAIQQARTQYPFMAGQVLIPSTKQGGEGWPAGEPGDASYPRPKAIPLNQPGAEIGPNSTPADVAGEALHSDRFANQTRKRLSDSFSPSQRSYLNRASLDAQNPDPEMSLRNGADSAIRGIVSNQWPKEAIAGMKYKPSQTKLIDSLRNYMVTGKVPK
jgi:hypothetical protein